MPLTLTFILDDKVAPGSNHMQLLTNPSAGPATTITLTGWTRGATVGGRYSSLQYGFERAAATFGSTVLPDTLSAPQSDDCFRTDRHFTGRFEAGNWVFDCEVISDTDTTAGSNIGKLRFRMWASSDPTGTTNYLEIHNTEVTSQWALPAIGVPDTVTKTFNPGAFTLNQEYLFFQVAHATDDHAMFPGPAGTDVLIRVNSSESTIVAPTDGFIPIEDDTLTPYGAQCGV